MVLLSVFILVASLTLGDGPAPLKAPSIKQGGGIALVAPGGYIADAVVSRTIDVLKGHGYRVIPLIPNRPRRGYLAADDLARLEMFNRALRDPDVDAILCMRGGYGTPRILDDVDYEAIRKSPKLIVGYSDITALLLAIRRRTGLVVFHGPMGADFAAHHSGLSPFSDRHFWGALGPENAGPGNSQFDDWGKNSGGGKPRTLVRGVAEGILAGGNLSMISATMGTPYEIDTRNAILFIEDVNEKPFRIDRMLAQLRMAGKLRQARGILLGSFTGCDAVNAETSLSLQQVFLDYFKDLEVPVLEGFPAGHGLRDHAVLPLGIKVRLDATRGTLSLLESPVRG